MENQFNIDLKVLIEPLNMVLLVLLFDLLLLSRFRLYIQGYNIAQLFLLLLLLFKMLRCFKECRIVGKKSLCSLFLKTSWLRMLTQTTWFSRSRDQKSLIKFFLWEDILILGILDLKLEQMMMEEDSLHALKQWGYFWKTALDQNVPLDLLLGVDKNGEILRMVTKPIFKLI